MSGVARPLLLVHSRTPVAGAVDEGSDSHFVVADHVDHSEPLNEDLASAGTPQLWNEAPPLGKDRESRRTSLHIFE